MKKDSEVHEIMKPSSIVLYVKIIWGFQNKY